LAFESLSAVTSGQCQFVTAPPRACRVRYVQYVRKHTAPLERDLSLGMWSPSFHAQHGTYSSSALHRHATSTNGLYRPAALGWVMRGGPAAGVGAVSSRDRLRVRMCDRLRDRRGGALVLVLPTHCNGDRPFQDLDLGHGRQDPAGRGLSRDTVSARPSLKPTGGSRLCSCRRILPAW
jgi:hypothetical protein